jgi:hypothetical protein
MALPTHDLVSWPPGCGKPQNSRQRFSEKLTIGMVLATPTAGAGSAFSVLIGELTDKRQKLLERIGPKLPSRRRFPAFSQPRCLIRSKH